jgi:transcriptional regulator with XRE-family HTH domain
MNPPHPTDQRWADVATAISARMADLVIDQAELARRADVSDATVRALMRARPRGEPRPNNLRKVSAALGWTPDSIDRILAGDDPVDAMPPQPADELRESVRDLASQVDEIQRGQETLSRETREQLAELTALVRAVVAQVVETDRPTGD